MAGFVAVAMAVATAMPIALVMRMHLALVMKEATPRRTEATVTANTFRENGVIAAPFPETFPKNNRYSEHLSRKGTCCGTLSENLSRTKTTYSETFFKN